MFSIPKHKVFLSFHHKDEAEVRRFENTFSDVGAFVSRAVQIGDIDPTNKIETIRREIRDRFISDSTVTIVLIGTETWKRKHVDWEIGYSLTSTNQNNRSGLIGILLPSYQKHNNYSYFSNCNTDYVQNNYTQYTPCNIPPRLYDNIRSGYTKIYSYPFSAYELQQWIHDAFQQRQQTNHINSRPYFGNNRSNDQTHWSD